MTHALAPMGGTSTDGAVATVDPRFPAPVNKRALAQYLALLEDPDALKLQNRLAGAYDAACEALLGKNDIQVEGGRSFKKKSAWRKLARHFGISTQVMEHSERYLIDETTGESVFVASHTVRGLAPWGQSSDASGACASDEETGRRKISIADAIATSETRAANRAISNLIAMGEVSAEEATREERTQAVAEAAAADMTLEQARALPFPWRTPAKYVGKTIGDLSMRILDAVLAAVEKEMETTGITPRRRELQRAAQLVKADREANPKQEPQPDAKAPAELPAEAPAPGVAELRASVTRLLAHPDLSEPTRASFRAWFATATDVPRLRELIHAIEGSIEASMPDGDEAPDGAPDEG